MKRYYIIIFEAIVLVALLFLTGCENRIAVSNHDYNHTKEDNDTINDHVDGSVEVEYVPTIFSTQEELVNAIKSSKIQILNENFIDRVDMGDIEFFYFPTASFSNFELLQIEVLAKRIIYYYIPLNTSEKQFNYDTGILVTYARDDCTAVEDSLAVLAEQENIDLTEDGFLYEPNHNSITFSAGTSWMSIRVPDDMNKYEQLKDLCTSAKISINDYIPAEEPQVDYDIQENNN